MGEADFNQFNRLRNHLVILAETFGRKENLSSVVTSTMSKKQLRLARKLAEVVDRANEKLCVTRLRYSFNAPESPYAQIGKFAGKRGVSEVSTNCLCEI